MARKAISLVFVLLSYLATITAQQNPTLKVMTQNMDAGTDLGYALFGLQQPDPRPYIDLTLAEVDASGIPHRASILAAEIAIEKPHLVALQEATLWRTGSTPATATTVRYDQLQLLMTALGELGASYKVLAVNTLTDIVAPTTESGPGILRFTDRDVLLARSDLSPSDFQVSDIQDHVYQASLNFGQFTVKRGFITALGRVNNRVFRIAATHLENKYPGVDVAAVIQRMQASELMNFMRNSPKPVILAGDYNADAIQGASGPGPDNTDTVLFIEAGGYADSWAAANGADPGPTWPLFLEDNTTPPIPPFFVNATPFERIDLIFSQGAQVGSSIQIGAGQTTPNSASDHVGVMATFQLVN